MLEARRLRLLVAGRLLLLIAGGLRCLKTGELGLLVLLKLTLLRLLQLLLAREPRRLRLQSSAGETGELLLEGRLAEAGGLLLLWLLLAGEGRLLALERLWLLLSGKEDVLVGAGAVGAAEIRLRCREHWRSRGFVGCLRKESGVGGNVRRPRRGDVLGRHGTGGAYSTICAKPSSRCIGASTWKGYVTRAPH